MSKALSSLAVGATIEVPVKAAFQSFLGQKVVFKVADKNHSGYPANSVTLITDKIPFLLAFDAIEASNSDSNRRSYGNNRYSLANLLQWLNSTAAAGTWYSAKHSADAPPTKANCANYNGYDTRAGFLAMLDDRFVAALLDTTVTVVKNTVTDGGSYETVTAKMHLPSTTEVGLANENNIAEGVKLALFSDNTSRLAYPTAECVSNSDYKNSSLNTSAAWYYWLRTPNSGDSYGVRDVYSSGALNNDLAYFGNRGVRPLCNLSSSILVSDTTNASGNYVFQWNAAPSTPSGISVPANCYSGQKIAVSWGASTDPEGDAITYILERATNNGSYAQVAATAARTFEENVPTSWNTVKYRVKARDSVGNESAYITSSASAAIHNQPPTISGQNADLGVKREGFSYAYTVDDPDGDIVTVVEKVDGKTLKTHTPTLGQSVNLTLVGNDFTSLTNAAHTITITATDSAGNEAVRTLTFTKAINSFVIYLSAPLEAVQQPKRANVVVTRNIPAGGTFKVEVTNNPFDPSPAWEDCTNAVLQGVAHVFQNTENAAVQYGLNVRVTVGRGEALSECWVSSIGGNFE